MTSSGKPSINNVIYSKETFEKMLEKQKDFKFKLCTGTDYYSDIEHYTVVRPETIVADVNCIRDGSIDISVSDDKVDYINKILDDGYVPGMRYMGKLSKPDKEGGICEVTDIHLICYDFVTSKRPNCIQE